ncbi:CCS [Acanthosepion pharaonis]|uniref:Superoxide dismutase copper chaperone n=1 Tax=Acanthosepion pharaonis TaxID=158019 RepID=A0A812BAH5_ACAPH|nr:CCS [Sepia pharaonis]
MKLHITEFAVKMSCNSCVKAVTKVLQGIDGIQSFNINLERQQVIIDSTLPAFKLKELIEKTGRQAVLTGFGITNTETHLGAAVAAIDTGNNVKGVIRMVQATPESCIIEGTIDGLTPGKNTVCIHQLGDISDGCNSCGDVYSIIESFNKTTGNIQAVDTSEDGRATFHKEIKNLKLHEIVGRSVVIHEGDLNALEKGSTVRVGCGIIARSAGIFENAKMLCACDGVSIWDERNRPIAGVGRSTIETPSAKI